MFALKFPREYCCCKYSMMKMRRVRYHYAVALLVLVAWAIVYVLLNNRPLDFGEERSRALPVRSPISTNIGNRDTKKEGNLLEPCEESTNIVFIKVHQAGGGVVANILQRFGDHRNLTFVLPKDDRTDSAGWPYCFHTNHMLPSSNGRYNILCNHAVYNRREFNKIMPKDTNYVTILRHPEQHFETLFNHYRFAEKLGIHSRDPFRSFLQKPEEFISRFASNENERFLLHNPMAYDLGFDPENFTNEEAVFSLINDIQKSFKLVMISDYLDESLVLLKRQMCWELDDVIYYKPSDAKIHSEHRSEVSSDLREKLQKWNFVDNILYRHFNKTFWKMVRSQGDDFYEEVEQLRTKNRQIFDFCMAEKRIRPTLGSNDHVITKPETLKLPFDAGICTKLDTSVPDYTKYLRAKPNQYIKWEL
ncbi:galactose-3-O-sulfotransferase 2-like [Glandiceps talaboti]